MSDPTRLRHAHSDADDAERALLESLRQQGPDAEQQAAMWRDLATGAIAAGVAVTVAPATAGATSTGTFASVAGSQAASVVLKGAATWAPKALAAKLLLAGAVAAGGIGGYVALREAPKPAARAAHYEPARDKPADVGPVVYPEPPRAEPAPVVVPDKPAVRTHQAPARVTPERLLEESKLMAAARAALRAGKLAETELLLHKLQVQFPHGELHQEWEVLQIEELFARGAHKRAAQRARTFVTRHPESPHSATLQRMLSAP